MILAGDIGGTKCNLGAFEERGATLDLVFQNRYATRDFSSFEQLVDTFETNKVAGIIATNTTVDHSSIPDAQDEQGGLSGEPLREKSTALVRAIAKRSTIPVIASGGIIDAESAHEKFEAGAQLLQIYTGLIYRGPALLREIAEAIA